MPKKNVSSIFPKKLLIAGCMAVVSVFFSSFAQKGSYSAPNPLPNQIDSAWRAMYGSPTHDAILVFNKMSGGATDATKDSVCIMHFGMAGSTAATMKNLMHYQQWAGAYPAWGYSSTYRISHDGSKIAMFNNNGVEVCDTNGTQLQIVKPSVNLNTDQLNMSWDDSASIRRIVYSIGSSILRTVVNENNTPGTTDTIWNHAWGKDPSTAHFSEYTSVNKVGNFLSFDIPDAASGNNDPIIVNLSTKTSMAGTPLDNSGQIGDGCQIRMLQDNLGTVSFHEATHLKAATLWRWPGTSMGTVPCPTNPACTDCGNNMFYWCDSDTNYMVQCGDNDFGNSPGCYTKAFIRKGKNSAHVMYLGDYVAFPALWINPAAPGTNEINEKVKPTSDQRVTVKMTGTELMLANLGNVPIDNAFLIGINGAVVARGQRTAPDQLRIAVSSVPAGMYILSWRSANSTSAKFVTVSK
jgi:hypothetical protein